MSSLCMQRYKITEVCRWNAKKETVCDKKDFILTGLVFTETA